HMRDLDSFPTRRSSDLEIWLRGGRNRPIPDHQTLQGRIPNCWWEENSHYYRHYRKGSDNEMSAYLDGHCASTVKAESSVVGRSWSLFQVCGYTGLALAIVLATTLVGHAGLSYWVMVGIAGTAVATFF